MEQPELRRDISSTSSKTVSSRRIAVPRKSATPGTTSAALPLDFGRFRRDLENNRRTQSPAQAPFSRSTIDRTDHAASPDHKDRPSRPSSNHRSLLISASSMVNPFTTDYEPPIASARKADSILPDFNLKSQPARPLSSQSLRSSSIATRIEAKQGIFGEGHHALPNSTYHFGNEQTRRKRPHSAAISDTAVYASGRTKESRKQTRVPRISRRERPTTESQEDVSLIRENKRIRQQPSDEQSEMLSPLSGQNDRLANSSRARGESGINSSLPAPSRIPSNLPSTQTSSRSGPSRTFTRPKPPGKHRHEVLSGQLNHQRDTNKTTTTAAEHSMQESTESFNRRMNGVREWIKERNPSLASPLLSGDSSTLVPGSPPPKDNEPSWSSKRKARKQLAPKDPKRWLSDGARSNGLSHKSATVSAPVLQRNDSIDTLATDAYVHPFRDQHEPEPTPTVDWSRFELPRKTSSSIGAAAASSTLHRSQQDSRRRSFKAGFLEHDETFAVSPLIKLRQSQLKQRQQEDFLGIKRPNEEVEKVAAGHEDSFQFNEALETWEREDDETLARNAAQESQAGHRGSSFDFSPTSPSTRAAGQDKSITKVPITPTAGLLRAVPFNGETSKKPVPEFDAKKTAAPTTPLRRVKDTLRPQPIILAKDVRLKPTSSSRNSTFADSSKTDAFFSQLAGIHREKPQGLFTPSKKRTRTGGQALHTSRSPFKSAPTTPVVMSRYIQLSNLSENEADQ